MERAKKMVLIPADGLKRFQRRMTEVADASQGSTATQGNPTSRLDHEMNNILNQDTKDNAEKWKLYQQALQRYLYFANEDRKPMELLIKGEAKGGVPKPADGTGDAASSSETVKTDASGSGELSSRVREVLTSVPARYNAKANYLMRLLSDVPSRFTWDKTGVISIDGVPVPGTNIVDLVNHATRSRKNFEPAGKLQFARFLHAINAPLEAVGNGTFWRDIRVFDDERTADVASTAASLAASSGGTLDKSRDSASRSRLGKWSRGELSRRSGIEDTESSAFDTPVTRNRRNSRGTPTDRDSGRKRSWRRLRLKQ